MLLAHSQAQDFGRIILDEFQVTLDTLVRWHGDVSLAWLSTRYDEG